MALDATQEVLKRAYLFPFKLQSDFARDNAEHVAALACSGLISTSIAPNQYGNKWRVTGTGLDHLRKLKLL